MQKVKKMVSLSFFNLKSDILYQTLQIHGDSGGWWRCVKGQKSTLDLCVGYIAAMNPTSFFCIPIYFFKLKVLNANTDSSFYNVK